ncbi:hypothetical protein ACPOL_3257 [Acidisarcina polymorpha]|uniref:Uncharacterized protein n=1 Tax=Acidisarcina polymorpha TaxID=2211140 RepID=A0A2Z5G0M4_9BACT|nr:hypothetical protein ACPOL_3257 [Acidisarcina polymorpha]
MARAVAYSHYLGGVSSYFNARGSFDSTPLDVPTGNRQPGCLCRFSRWALAPQLDSLSACPKACSSSWVHMKYTEKTPIIMSLVLGIIMAFIAYGRLALAPL